MGSSSRAVAVGSPPAHPFEFPSFASGSPATMCIAGDVISSGKLLPFCGPPPPPTKAADSLLSGTRIGAGYRKLRKESDPNPDPLGRRRRKNRWYVLAFGSVKVPAGMEMKEIRIRQQRMASAAAEAKEDEEWGPWKLLRSLSCRGVEVAGDCHRRIVL